MPEGNGTKEVVEGQVSNEGGGIEGRQIEGVSTPWLCADIMSEGASEYIQNEAILDHMIACQNNILYVATNESP